MNYFFLKSLVIITVFFVVELHAIAHKPWTFLVYIAAAHDLCQRELHILHDLMCVGSNNNCNVLVYVTMHENGQCKQTKKLYINHDSITQIGETMMRDSGHVATLVEALQWAAIDYPSDYSAVVLCGSGSGQLNRSKNSLLCRGMCYDDDTEHYLTDRDCLQALSWVRDMIREGKKLDIVAFDTSFSASLEMAYTLASCADYMVACQEDIVDGVYNNYSYIVERCMVPNIKPFVAAQVMVDLYEQCDSDEAAYIVSAIDLHQSLLLVENCNAVAQILMSQLKGENNRAVKATLRKCIQTGNCISFNHGMYIDLLQFYNNVLIYSAGLTLSPLMESRFKQLLIDGIDLFSTVIMAQTTSKHYQHVGGLSVYFSRYSLDFSYYGLYWTEKNPMWLNFLEAYLT